MPREIAGRVQPSRRFDSPSLLLGMTLPITRPFPSRRRAGVSNTLPVFARSVSYFTHHRTGTGISSRSLISLGLAHRCDGISKAFYDGRLIPEPGNERQCLVLNSNADPALAPTGLVYPHEARRATRENSPRGSAEARECAYLALAALRDLGPPSALTCTQRGFRGRAGPE